VPGDQLDPAFETAVSGLRAEGWRVENMVAGALKRGEEPALLTALRLVPRIPEFHEVPGVIPSLTRLLNEGIHPQQTMTALAVLDGPRGVEALGKALLEADQRDFALTCLEAMGEESAAEFITRSLLKGKAFSQAEPMPFEEKALVVLTGLGPEGVRGILQVYERSGYNPDLIRGLSPPSRVFRLALVEELRRIRGSQRQAGFMLAASLRMGEAIPIWRKQMDSRSLRSEDLSLLTMTGGFEAVHQLVDLYQGPVSLKERKRLSAALASIFRLYRAETDEVMAEALVDFSPDSWEVLVEMLSRGEDPGTCEALAWVVRHHSVYADQAVLALAHTGSAEALESLLNLFRSNQLDPGIRTAVGAAAYYLGGDPVLAWIEEEKAYDFPELLPSSRRRALTEARFRKMQEMIADYSNP
jgi:hypothetical protein